MNILFLLDAAPAQTTEKLSIFKLVFDPASLWIMIPLMLMLVWVIYVFIERFLAINAASREERTFLLHNSYTCRTRGRMASLILQF